MTVGMGDNSLRVDLRPTVAIECNVEFTRCDLSDLSCVIS